MFNRWIISKIYSTCLWFITQNLENGLWLMFQFVDDDKKIKFQCSQTHQKDKWARTLITHSPIYCIKGAWQYTLNMWHTLGRMRLTGMFNSGRKVIIMTWRNVKASDYDLRTLIHPRMNTSYSYFSFSSHLLSKSKDIVNIIGRKDKTRSVPFYVATISTLRKACMYLLPCVR